jgi:hypothetical protein
MIGVTGVSRRTSSAPTPTGPPILWPVTVSASTPLRAKSTGTWPTACTASVWNGMPCVWATSASSRIGLTVPTSLLAHITVTRATSAGFSAMAAASVSACTRPKSSTSSQVTAAPASATRCSITSSTAWCSMAGAMMRWRRGSAATRAR